MKVCVCVFFRCTLRGWSMPPPPWGRHHAPAGHHPDGQASHGRRYAAGLFPASLRPYHPSCRQMNHHHDPMFSPSFFPSSRYLFIYVCHRPWYWPILLTSVFGKISALFNIITVLATISALFPHFHTSFCISVTLLYIFWPCL